jgi:hypothetical protein
MNRSKSKETHFNKEYCRSTMKAMVANTLPKTPNSLEIHNIKLTELDKRNKVEKKRLEVTNSHLNILINENQESSKLLEYYRNIVVEKKKQISKQQEEAKIEEYRHEMQKLEAQKELEHNLKEINLLRDQLIKKDGEIKAKRVCRF